MILHLMVHVLPGSVEITLLTRLYRMTKCELRQVLLELHFHWQVGKLPPTQLFSVMLPISDTYMIGLLHICLRWYSYTGVILPKIIMMKRRSILEYVMEDTFPHRQLFSMYI